jgi:hypothetical protein
LFVAADVDTAWLHHPGELAVGETNVRHVTGAHRLHDRLVLGLSEHGEIVDGGLDGFDL